jgi:MarR family transcriptional regulator, transcriptional regulator for hemolysin
VKDTNSTLTAAPKELDPGRAVALKLSVVARQLRVSFDQSAEMGGLTRAQWTLIAVVARVPGATQRTVAEALEVREITAGRLIDRLCEEGFLRRDENPSDRRAYCVHLTAAAEPVLAKLDDLARIHEGRIFSGFEPDALEKLDTLLDRIAQNLSELRARQTQSQRAAAK